MLSSLVETFRFSLHRLIDELQTYTASYQDEEFRFGCGLLLLLPIWKVFTVFLDEINFGEEQTLWRIEIERIWKWIPGSARFISSASSLPYD
jgi:hypothetical protein